MANLQHRWKAIGASDHRGGPKVWECRDCEQTVIQKKKPPVSHCLGDPAARLRAEVEQEIKDHPNWCGPGCQTFLPSAYREMRIDRDHGAKTVQEQYDLCHIWR